MKITKKLATKFHEGARRKNKKNSVICVICGFISLLIITLSLSLPVYSKSKKEENKGKSSSPGVSSSTQNKKTPQFRSKSTPSRSTPSPGIGNKKRSGGWGNNSTNQGKSGQFGRKPGKIIRHPPKPPPRPPEPIPKPPPVPPDPRPPRPPCPPGPGYLPIIIDPIPGDETEENLAPPDQGETLTPRKSYGLPGKEYISDSFVPDRMLVDRIEAYNAKHLHSLGLEYPLTRRSESLTYQLLDSLELIERMEKKIKYYKQQLETVRNSDLGPVERSSKELFWLERLDRLQESKEKEEERVFDLRSGIEEENRNSINN